MRPRTPVATALLSLAVFAACRDLGPDDSRTARPPLNANRSSSQPNGVQHLDKDRKDTRWEGMSDPQFTAEVSKANGRVTIGLRDSAAAAGVDNMGRVLASPTGVRRAKEMLQTLGVKTLYEFKRIPAIVASVSPEAAVALRRNPMVDYIQPSLPGEWHTQTTPWNVTKVNASQAWSYSTGPGATLLILDSGIDSLPRDLNVPVAWRCISGYVVDHLGHGTFVAGVAAGLNNSLDVVGVSYGVTLKSANNEVSGHPDPAETACSVDAARVNGVDVVNMSFGFSEYTALTDEINGGYNDDDMIFVASAGNSNGGAVTYPATLGNVIAVTATDSTNAHASFAAIGSKIELSAPGVDVLSTSKPSGTVCTTGGYTAICSGTSFAAPHVSAAAALLRSAFPSWSNATIRDRLRASATDLGTAGFDNTFGYGLLNVVKAFAPAPVIGGTTFAYAGYSSTWSASVSGGQSPFSYQWYVNGSAAGTGSSINYTPSSDFWLKVQVTDNLSAVGKDSIYVTVSSCTPPQISC